MTCPKPLYRLGEIQFEVAKIKERYIRDLVDEEAIDLAQALHKLGLDEEAHFALDEASVVGHDDWLINPEVNGPIARNTLDKLLPQYLSELDDVDKVKLVQATDYYAGMFCNCTLINRSSTFNYTSFIAHSSQVHKVPVERGRHAPGEAMGSPKGTRQGNGSRCCIEQGRSKIGGHSILRAERLGSRVSLDEGQVVLGNPEQCRF